MNTCCQPACRGVWMMIGAGLLVVGVATGHLIGWLLP